MNRADTTDTSSGQSGPGSGTSPAAAPYQQGDTSGQQPYGGQSGDDTSNVQSTGAAGGAAGGYGADAPGDYDRGAGAGAAAGDYDRGSDDEQGSNKPGLGSRIKGGLQTVAGKATRNPGLVAQGQERKAGTVPFAPALD
jgi:hypothetical protein